MAMHERITAVKDDKDNGNSKQCTAILHHSQNEKKTAPTLSN
jgi:hypothetical protein